MIQKHIVLIKGEDGSCVSYPMKPWLRENRGDVPVDMDPDENNSHTLRCGLRNKGWNMVEKPDQIILIMPRVDGDVSYADAFLDSLPVDVVDNEKEVEEAD